MAEQYSDSGTATLTRSSADPAAPAAADRAVPVVPAASNPAAPVATDRAVPVTADLAASDPVARAASNPAVPVVADPVAPAAADPAAPAAADRAVLGAAGSGPRGATSGTLTKPVPFAAVSFVCGLVGLLVANLLLGPLAVILGVVGLRVDQNRRGRAALGILLGVADIAVFLFLAVHAGAHHGSISWNFFGH